MRKLVIQLLLAITLPNTNQAYAGGEETFARFSIIHRCNFHNPILPHYEKGTMANKSAPIVTKML
jgi:hypothetical protein